MSCIGQGDSIRPTGYRIELKIQFFFGLLWRALSVTKSFPSIFKAKVKVFVIFSRPLIAGNFLVI